MLKPPWPANVSNGARRYYNGNGSWVYNDGMITRYVGQQFSSVKTPNWKHRNARTRDGVKNPFLWSVGTYAYKSASITWRGSWANNGATGYCFSGRTSASIETLVPSSARSKALSQMQGRVSRASVNLAQAFAERKQAASMLSKTANKVVKLAWDIKRGRFESAAQDIFRWTGVLPGRGHPIVETRFSRRGNPYFKRRANYRPRSEEFANQWLEYQYGWRPLLSDIYGSCELIARTYHERRPTSVTGVGHANGPLSAVTNWSQDECVAATRWVGRYTDTHRFTASFVEDDALAEALSNTGISNPLLLAWELVPYSFVLDWFIPVGNYLEQLTYAQGLRFISGTESRRFRSSMTGSHYNPGGQVSYVSNVAIGGSADYTYAYKQRWVLSSWPYQKFPPFKPQLGVERTLNAIALLTQIFNGKPPRSRSF